MKTQVDTRVGEAPVGARSRRASLPASTADQTHRYCPACKEYSAIDGCDRCLWCGGETRLRPAGGRPVGVHGKLRDRHLRLLHKLNVEEEIPVRELARRIQGPMGFASEGSAAEAIRIGFKRLGLEALPWGVALRRAGERRRAPGSPGTADPKAHKRWSRKQKGGLRKCQGTVKYGRRKGEACGRYALADSDFCLSHDETRAEQRRAQLAAMIAKQSRMAVAA